MKRKLIVLIILGLISIQLQGWPWGSAKKESQPQVSLKEMERTLARLEKFAQRIEKLSEVDWNPVYAGLCLTIKDYGSPVVPLLLRDMQDEKKDWKYRYMLMTASIFVKDKTPDDQEKIVDVMMMILRDEAVNKKLMKHCVWVLSRLAETSSLMDGDKREKVAKELVVLAQDNAENLQMRMEILRDLSRFAKRYGEILVEPLMELSTDANNKIRAESMSTLVTVSNFSQDEGVKSRINSHLVTRLKIEQDNRVKDEIIFGIKTGEVKEAIPLLMESLKTGKYCHQSRAAELLGIMEVKEAVPLLIEGLMNERNSLIAYRSAEALGNIGDKRAIEPLIDLLDNVRWGEIAAIPLAKIGDKRAIQPLIEKLEEETVFAWDIAQALIMLNAREAIPLIESKMPKGKLYGSAQEFKENFEKFKMGNNIEWENE